MKPTIEIVVSPTGNIFETAYDSRRVPAPIGHADWNSHMVARANVEGSVNDETPDHGYTVELSIPWSALSYGDMPASIAPPAGASWRFNFYVMDSRPDGSQRGEGWSPTLVGDYHVPARFGRVTFQAPIDPSAQMIHLSPDQIAELRPITQVPVMLPRGATTPTAPASGVRPH